MPKESTNERERQHESQRDDDKRSAERDPEGTTEDQAANMDYEGDTPH
ncbi:hypothetical protein ACFVUS_26765 [Nocardia sp. NPDC058058]